MDARRSHMLPFDPRPVSLALALLVGLPVAARAQQEKAKGTDRAEQAAWWTPAAAQLQSLGWMEARKQGEGPAVFRAELRETERTRPGRGHGPAFCRTGAGHPVHGRDWCLEKGFGLGDDRALEGLDDIILGPEDRGRERLEERDVLDVLGEVILGRITDAAGVPGADLDGRYVREGVTGRVLQLRSAGSPVAELVDTDGDGHVDGLILAPDRRSPR